MMSNYVHIGISFTKEDQELKEKLLTCFFRDRGTYNLFIDVFRNRWWDKSLPSLVTIGNKSSYLIFDDGRCTEERMLNLFTLSNMLFPGTFMYYETYEVIRERIYEEYFEGEGYKKYSIFYDDHGNVENKETLKILLDKYGNEDELYDQGHQSKGEFSRVFMDPVKMEKHIIKFETNQMNDIGGGTNGADEYVSYIRAYSIKQNALDRNFLSEIIDESIKNNFTDFTALLLEKCKG